MRGLVSVSDPRRIRYIVHTSILLILFISLYLSTKELSYTLVLGLVFVLFEVSSLLLERDLFAVALLVYLVLSIAIYINNIPVLAQVISIGVAIFIVSSLIDYLSTKSFEREFIRYIDTLYVIALVIIAPIYTHYVVQAFGSVYDEITRFGLGFLVGVALYYALALLSRTDLSNLLPSRGILMIDIDLVISILSIARALILVAILFLLLSQEPIASLLIILSEAIVYIVKRTDLVSSKYRELINLATPVVLALYLRVF